NLDKKDQSIFYVTGQRAGVTRVALTTKAGTEVWEFTVEIDLEYLRNVLRRVVPTATVEVIPLGNDTIILNGTVQRAEDVPILVDTATTLLGVVTVQTPQGPQQARRGGVINALRVGGVQQVELCVTIARVARSEARSMGFSFLETGQQ